MASAVFCTAVAFVGTNGYQRLFSKKTIYLKGSQLVKPVLHPADKSHRYLWGNSFLSFDEARKHFLAIGSPGSGKTLNILLLLKCILARMKEPDSDVRLLIYDSKTDLLPYLANMIPPEQIRILNPTDARCHAWDIAKDITDSAMADDFASVLLPLEKGAKEPYFRETAQRFLAGIIEAFMEHGNAWTLRDLILASKTTERLRAVFLSCPETEDLLQHFETETAFRSVKSTLDGVLRSYRSIAAVWKLALEKGHSFHINDWNDENGENIKGWISSQEVLVLGNSPRAKAPLSRVNQLLSTQVGKAILDREGYSNSEHWIVLDEFRELGLLPNISDLMITGRSKGAAVVLGFQDISGVEEIYGEKLAREIVGCTQNVAILHVNSSQPHTRDWVANIMGDITTIHAQKSTNTDSHGKVSRGVADQRITEKKWLAVQFAEELSPASLEEGMVGLYKSTGNFYKQKVSGKILFGPDGSVNRLPEMDRTFENREPITREMMKLKDWDADDIDRLGIPELKAFLSIKDSGRSSLQIPVPKVSLDSFQD